MLNEKDRARGILSPADREYLSLPAAQYDEKHSQSARIQRRNTIPERVWNAFLDGRLLYNNIDIERRQEIFNGWKDFAEPFEGPDDEDLEADRPDNFASASEIAKSRGEWLEQIAAERGFAGWFGFLYLGLTESDKFDFSNVIERAVRSAERSRDREVSSFELEIEAKAKPSIDELHTRFEQRDELTPAEINRLREAGVVGDADLIKFYEEFESTTPHDTV